MGLWYCKKITDGRDQASSSSTAVPGGYGRTGLCTDHLAACQRAHKRPGESTLAATELWLSASWRLKDAVQIQETRQHPGLLRKQTGHKHTLGNLGLLRMLTMQTLPPPSSFTFISLLKNKIVGRQKIFNHRNTAQVLQSASWFSSIPIPPVWAGSNQLSLTSVVTALWVVNPHSCS